MAKLSIVLHTALDIPLAHGEDPGMIADDLESDLLDVLENFYGAWVQYFDLCDEVIEDENL